MIRPIDLQNTVLALENTPAVQRAESGPRIDAQLAQAAFVAEMSRRDEEVAPTVQLSGNRVDAKDDESRKRANQEKREKRGSFDQSVDDSLEPADELPHVIDLMA